MYRFAPASSVIPSTCARLSAVELLEVSQRHHLAVQGVEGVERLLDPEDLLGPDRRVRRRCEPAQEHRGQGGRTGLGRRVAVDRDFLSRVAHLRPEVPPVIDGEPLADDTTQPEERRQVRATEIRVQVRGGIQEGILEHVRGVDPALEPDIHA